MKVWASTVKDEKITRDVLFDYEHADNLDDFISLLQNVCEQMDIPTPITTFVNFTHYVMFNNTRFKPRDFVESVDFDLLNGDTDSFFKIVENNLKSVFNNLAYINKTIATTSTFCGYSLVAKRLLPKQ